jgi:hypothetical protein
VNGNGRGHDSKDDWMAQGWRKHPYDQRAFGQHVQSCRRALGWSLHGLARASAINRGTLWKVEEEALSLPPAKRERLVEVLRAGAAACALGREAQGDFLLLRQVAGLAVLPEAPQCSSGASVQAAQAIVATAPRVPARVAIVEPPSERSHAPPTMEAQALALERELAWPEAATLWRLIADHARREGDQNTWARALLHLGTVYTTLGWCEDAVSVFQEVLRRTQEEPNPFDTVPRQVVYSESLLRVGWLRFEQDAYKPAVQYLQRGLAGLRALREQLRDQAHSGRLEESAVVTGPWSVGPRLADALWRLEEFGNHFLGRALGELSTRERDGEGLQRALDRLRWANRFNVERHLTENVGFGLLRQAFFHAQLGEERIVGRLLRESEELMGDGGLFPAHRAWTRARLLHVERPGRARDELAHAEHDFATPIFYSRGMARVLAQKSLFYLEEGTAQSDQQAFCYAAVAAAVFPYGDTLEAVGAAAAQLASRTGVGALRTLWRETQAAIWAMEAEPYVVLRDLFIEYGYTRGVAHLESALQQTEKRIREAIA